MATTTNVTPVASLQASVNNNSTVTVPPGVTPQHLGIAVFVSANLYSTGTIPAIAGWNSRVSNPSVANTMEWTVLTRLGGHSAGDTITLTQNKTTQFDLYMIWYDTGGLDINQISTPAGRGTSNSQYTAITGLTASAQGQTAIVVATERSTTTGTNITSWSGSYTPGADNFIESTTSVFSSNFFGHFLINSSTSTGTLTATYNTSSGNGAGVIFTLGVPSTGSFQDPFTTASWSGSWSSMYDDSEAPMGGGEWKLPFTTDYPYFYPYGQVFLFNMSTMAVQVRMDAVGNEGFSMRLTTDPVRWSGSSFVSVGISTGGALYMNQRTYNSGTQTSSDDVFTSSTHVQAGVPVVLRLRHGGGSLVYGEYSYDYVNWTTFASKTVTCFNPTTDLVVPMFQSGNSVVDEMTTYAHISNMNTGRYTPYNPPFRAVTQWTYWDGTKEVEVPAGPGFSWEGPFYVGPRVRSLSTAEIATGTAVTVSKPAGVKAGDYLVAAIAQRDGTIDVPTPSGWTFVNGYDSGGSAGQSIGLFRKVATASEPASYTFNVNKGPASAHILRVSNTSGFDVAGDSLAMGGTNLYGFPTNTAGPGAPGDLAINVVALSSTTDTVNYPATDTLVANTTGVGLRLVVTTEQRLVAGILGTRQWTLPFTESSVAVGVRSYLMSNGTVL